jgi:predicted RNA-binding protein with PUA-like domain
MVTLKRGNRLSITPVTPAEWKIVEKLARTG